ncbi:hypothetical protein D0809_23100 [Flavobacterium circumlabens]|uniref:Uncharacterized protein n=1 Tax=Flavobacterium circumlabens TaxID=2133765 RepID=A0A4Y7U7Z2_9FLAO|nr:hypothetical protein [Flavobacterium circumlabens]TCN51112.1 hypothetical protein EV142_11379 [Flavobacterium circumlabens]TEB41929.1 hypothetical protein D0809_23100 [Flavobacterium circumlabens]
MKKKFTLEIASPCSENFDKMIPNSSGSFCDSCMKNVIDLSGKTNSEVARFVAETKDKNICARLKVTQLEEEFQYNETSRINNFKYAAVAASVLITSNIAAQEKIPVKTEIACTKPNSYTLGKVAYSQVAEKEILITIKGKLLEAKTNRPLNKETYPNLNLTINDSQNAVKINPETGDFSIVAQVLESSKTFMVTITGSDYYLSKEIAFTKKAVKGSILNQNIIIAAEELTKIYIAGGLGINYNGNK